MPPKSRSLTGCLAAPLNCRETAVPLWPFPRRRAYRGDDPHRLAARTSARHDVMMICAKYAIEMSRDRERERILSDLTRREFGDEA